MQPNTVDLQRLNLSLSHGGLSVLFQSTASYFLIQLQLMLSFEVGTPPYPFSGVLANPGLGERKINAPHI